MFSVTTGNTEKLEENFELCVALIVIIIGLAALGTYRYDKERKSIAKKNKLIIDKKNEIYDTKGKRIQINEGVLLDKKRLPPRKDTLRELLKKSGNDCQFQPCPNVIIDYRGFLQGHVVSITSNEKSQPNYNPNLSNEDRIKIDNLMLLCHDHFFELKLQEKHTVDVLHDKKIQAEEAPNRDKNFEFSEQILDELILGYVDRYL